MVSSIISVISLVVSAMVAWKTLLQRGTLKMTQPVQVAFLYENGTNAKIFLWTLLYSTGKRGHVVEGLYLKVLQPDSTQTFGLWAYGERGQLTVAGGLRVTDEGLAYNHHFLRIEGQSYFVEGEYEVNVYARLVNIKDPQHLATIRLALTETQATSLHLQRGALFTWNPETQDYQVSFEESSGFVAAGTVRGVV